MEVRFLGGAREVGRSALLVDDRLLLDFGMGGGNPPQYPVETPEPEAVVVSHGHLDHAGAVPALLSGDRRPAVHWTPPTAELARELGRDTLKLHGNTPSLRFHREELNRLGEVAVEHGYGESFEVAEMEVTLYDAGHIPGSAHVLVDDGTDRLLYTGDFYAVPDDEAGDPDRTGLGGDPIRGQRLVAPTTARPAADLVICESTYSDVTHDPRGVVEERFVESVRTTLWEGGTVVVPAFAIGRTQEMLLICAEADVPCYVDGMGVDVTRTLRRHPEFVRSGEALRRAAGHARVVDGRDGQRRRIAEENVAVVTTSGMLSGGPAMTYVPAVRRNPTNTIALTGYQVEGTPGRELLDTGSAEIDGRHMRVAAGVEAYDFSAHADREGLLSYLSAYRDTPVVVNHGDRCPAFATELDERGYDAAAPDLGETVTL